MISNDCSIRKVITDLPLIETPSETDSYLPLSTRNISGNYVTYKLLISKIPLLGSFIRFVSQLNNITSFPSDTYIPLISRTNTNSSYTNYKIPISSLPIPNSVTEIALESNLRTKVQLGLSEISMVSDSTTLDVSKNLDCFVDCTNNLTITLPSSAIDGRRYFFKRIDNLASKTLTIVTQGSEKIDGNDSITLDPYDSVSIVSIQSNYYIS